MNLTFSLPSGRVMLHDVADGGTIKIGSLASSQLRLEGEGVTRMHSVIEVVKGEAFIIDLGSDAGTVLNGKKVSKAKLYHGDEIRIGSVRFTVFTGSTLQPPPPPPPPPPTEPTYREAAPQTAAARSSAVFCIEFSTTTPTYYNGMEAGPLRNAKTYTLPDALRAVAELRSVPGTPRIVEVTTSLREVTQAECRDALLSEVETLVKKAVP